MPELAEVRIMSEYINEVAEGRIFRNIRKSTVSKVKTSMKNPFEDLFRIEATSRGKELKIDFISRDGRKVPMTFSMGMSGMWQIVPTGNDPKHAHFMMDSTDGHTLCLVDVRRFAKWKWADWNHGRGPDPTREFEQFRKNILDNINHKNFNSPICSVLMSQTWFNGIGNYLRSTILYRADQNPFENAREAILKNPRILELCEKIPMEAYYLAGGQLKDWANPFGKEEQRISFREWVFYYKGISCIDESGRRLWFDPKWRESCSYQIKE
jgi:endonuclease VIII-like 1